MTHIIGPDDNDKIVDARGAVLLDFINTCVVGLDGDQRGVAMDLGGRINQSSARSSTLYLFDFDAAAKVAADLIGRCARAGRAAEVMEMLTQHLSGQLR